MKKNLTPLVLSHDPVWAIESQRGRFLWKQLGSINADGHRMDFEAFKESEIEAKSGKGEADYKPYEMVGSTAIISITGPMMKSPSSFSSSVSTVYARRLLRAATNDKDVTNILIRFDSPGGSVSGTQDLADEIYSTNRKKECIAYVEDCCCSAAYWCASQCSAIYANRTAVIGSIGTYMVIEDFSRYAQNVGIEVHVLSTGKFKGAGVEGSEITSEQLAHFQQTVDDLNEHFVSAVANGRNMARETLDQYADGRVWIGDQAQAIGLVDGIASMDDVLNDMGRKGRKSAVNASQDNDFATDDALPAGATSEQTLDSVLAAVERANERFETIRGLRASQGRKLGSDRIKQLQKVHAELGDLVLKCLSLPVAEQPSATPTETQDPNAMDALLNAAAVAELSLA